MKKILLLTMLLVGCSKSASNPEQETKPIEKTKMERLADKTKLYLSLQDTALDAGWPRNCDAVGFLALCKTAGGCTSANFFDGEQEAGKWQRNKEHNCVETGKSKTSISKDMLMMGFLYGVYGMEKDVAKGYFLRLEKYGREHDFIMGYPSTTVDELGRVYMTPTMIKSLYQILEKLTGKKYETNEKMMAVPKGYQGHLRLLDILIQGKLRGGIDKYQMDDLTELHDRDSKNALNQAAFHRYKDGVMDEVADILLDEKLFPADRLPTSKDRCEEYLWQRDQGSDWLPCDKTETHNAIDYLFAYWVAGFK